MTAKSIGGRDTLAVLSLRVTEGSGSIDSATVESLASPCSEQCDGDGGKCDNEGRCVCKQGRTGPDCSKSTTLQYLVKINIDSVYIIFFIVENPDFPTDPAAKLDIALSILAAILLVSLVVCALLPKRQISCRRESRDNQSGILLAIYLYQHLHSHILINTSIYLVNKKLDLLLSTVCFIEDVEKSQRNLDLD